MVVIILCSWDIINTALNSPNDDHVLSPIDWHTFDRMHISIDVNNTYIEYNIFQFKCYHNLVANNRTHDNDCGLIYSYSI